MVDGLLAKLSNGIVPLNCSCLFAVSLCCLARGSHLWHFDSWSEEFLDKVSVMNRLLLVDCQERFPVSVGRGSTKIEDLERLRADWERDAPGRARRMARGPITRTRQETTQTATPTQRPDPSRKEHRQATFGPPGGNSPFGELEETYCNPPKIVVAKMQQKERFKVGFRVGTSRCAGTKLAFRKKGTTPAESSFSRKKKTRVETNFSEF